MKFLSILLTSLVLCSIPAIAGESEAEARITKIEKVRVQSGKGKETGILCSITVPAQKIDFWGKLYITVNARDLNNRPIQLKSISSQTKRWHNRKYYCEFLVTFPQVKKIYGIQVVFKDKDDLEIDTETLGKYVEVDKETEVRLRVAEKWSTGNGHVKCYTK